MIKTVLLTLFTAGIIPLTKVDTVSSNPPDRAAPFSVDALADAVAAYREWEFALPDGHGSPTDIQIEELAVIFVRALFFRGHRKEELGTEMLREKLSKISV